jgi:hemerythrin-like metal-binding protein/PAS domain S-box-containing protein
MTESDSPAVVDPSEALPQGEVGSAEESPIAVGFSVLQAQRPNRPRHLRAGTDSESAPAAQNEPDEPWDILGELSVAAMMVRDRDGIIRGWSAGCERLYGFSAAEAVGRSTYELLRSGCPAAASEAALQRDGQWSGELHRCRKDGTPIAVLAQLTLQPASGGWRAAVLEVGIDATAMVAERRAAQQAEARLRTQDESLRTEVVELRRRLAHAQKLASVGQLTSSIAHDFNNFLTVILGNSEQLRASAEAAGDARGVRRAEMIERAGERGARLAAQLLAFARKQTLFPETTAVEPLLTSMQELLRRAAGETNELQIRCAPDVWTIRVDPTQLESALLNLVINARDAMAESGGGAVTVLAENVTLNLAAAARLRLPPGDYVRIGVADAGVGIAPEVLERVLEPFYTTKEAGKGSGLGLSQVHGFVGQSGGCVDIDSEIGRGTTVALLLPRGPAAATQSAPQPAVGMPGGGRCVLIVEDDADLSRAARVMLEQRGYHVLEAQDPDGARRLLAAAPVSVLFADLVLPGGMSGIDLAREARRLRPDVRVLLTGSTADMLDEHRVDVQEFQFLLKPYSADKLVARMARLVPGAVPSPLLWSSAHELGVRQIDEQHARLGALLNELAGALRGGEDHATLLREIVRYTEFHFAAEESLMAAHAYQGAAAHQQAHHRLLEEVRAFRPDADGVSVSLALRYLQEWLLHHVDGADRDLAEALRGRGVQ